MKDKEMSEAKDLEQLIVKWENRQGDKYPKPHCISLHPNFPLRNNIELNTFLLLNFQE
jgi:hypothetical protein